MEIIIHSNIGKRRKSNQDYADYFTSKAGQALYVLCDGVGGSQAGDVASEMTTKYIGEQFQELSDTLSASDLVDWLRQTTVAVNKYIYDKGQSIAEYNGMSTTVVMAVIVDGEIIVCHVGDSRAYIYSQGEMTQITEDHSLVNELIRTGELTEEEGAVHPQRNVVTQAIGGPRLNKVEITQVTAKEVEILMLCSDGLSNMVTKDELVEMFKSSDDLDTLGKELIDAANNAGGKDNITLILVSGFNGEGGEQE